MHSNNTIQKELLEISPLLANISNTNIFTAPEGYFDTLSAELLIAVNPPIANVPEGYFDNLAESILSKIRAVEVESGETNEVSSLLAPLQSINVFNTPENYFEQLPAELLKKLPKPAVVIGINSKTSFFRYAVAAVITGVLGMGLFTAFDKHSFNDSTGSNAVILAQAGTIVKENSFDKILETISDEDIVHYLQNNGQDVNAALVASITDEKILPNPEDYITDDQALDNLLNDLNIKQTSNN